jgi:ATP-dependent DNA helicase RecQ
MVNTSKHILKGVFGYDEFRPLQAEVIDNVLKKHDTLVIMPTGGGKSLCYQIPALIFPGLTIVVSPLISLMKDQVDQLIQAGAPAAFLNSSLTTGQFRRNVEAVKDRTVKLLYMAPEALLRPNMVTLLSSLRVDCLTIDEAHCISEWGHDFRPEYRQIAEVRGRFPDAVCMALTATATPRVREDIKTSLGFKDSNEFVGSFNRENLFIRVAHKQDPFAQTVEFIEEFPDQSGIIYCFSRRQVDDLSEALHKRGYSVLPYHAGMSDKDRNQNQELFIRDDVQIMVATIAFGMGIDKPNVRFVVHYDLPKNMESYYQEIGRAGRDGLPAHCLLLFSYGDIQKVKHFIDQKPDHEQRIANIHLNAFLGFIETEECRRIPLLNYFGEAFTGESCGACDSCLTDEKDLTDITVAAQKFLSCVKRTGERFGAGHIIDILRGSKAKKVVRFGHHQLSTYGIGEEHSKKEWFYLSRQFIQKRLLNQDMEFGGLSLTDKAWKIMRGEEKVLGRLVEQRVEQETEEEKKYDRVLFDILRKERKRLADSANVPPYVIFPDRTLMEMATFFPQSEMRLMDIHGVGAAKQKTYGPLFLNIIREYCKPRGIEESLKGNRKRPAAIPASIGGKRHVIVGELFNSGETVADLMERFNIKRDTVLNHLYTCFQEGYGLIESDEFLSLSSVSPDKQKYILNRFEALGVERLRPVWDALDGEVDYKELQILRLHYVSRRGFSKTTPEDIPLRQPSPTPKEIICLANSRKYSGRCIAGREISGGRIGEWVRPVGHNETGELPVREICYRDGNVPRLLDVIAVPLSRHAPHSYQTENYLVDEDVWIRKRSFPVADLPRLCDPVDSLWLNGYSSGSGLNDRVPEAIAREHIRTSLLFIRPEQAMIAVEEGPNLLKRLRARFHFVGEEYCLPVTDPEVENRYLGEPLGRYPLATGELYFTISLGEPYEGYCYKLVAGIVGLRDEE